MDEPAHYEIRVAEYLDQRWAHRLDGLEIAHPESGETIIRGEMPDQPALFGVLGRLRDLGVTLVSVRRMGDLNPGVRVSNTTQVSNGTNYERR